MDEVIITPEVSPEAYKLLRLEAVGEEPMAFVPLKEEVEKSPPEKWQAYLEASQKLAGACTLFAVTNGKPIGMIGATWDSKFKTSHVGHIFGMFVSNSFRGKGVAQKLHDALEEVLQTKVGITKLLLEVVTTQLAAVKFYEKLGYRIVGETSADLKQADGSFSNIYIMEKFLQ